MKLIPETPEDNDILKEIQDLMDEYIGLIDRAQRHYLRNEEPYDHALAEADMEYVKSNLAAKIVLGLKPREFNKALLQL